MFWNKEFEVLANSIIRFCKNRLKELDCILTVEKKDIFKETIFRIENLKSENLPKLHNIGDA